jgi:hypothetical protein
MIKATPFLWARKWTMRQFIQTLPDLGGQSVQPPAAQPNGGASTLGA